MHLNRSIGYCQVLMPFNVAIQETRHFKGMQQVFPNPRICAQAFVPTRIFFQYYCLRFQFASSETVTLSLSISFCNFFQARISVALCMYATGVGLANMCVFVVFFVLLLFFFWSRYFSNKLGNCKCFICIKHNLFLQLKYKL